MVSMSVHSMPLPGGHSAGKLPSIRSPIFALCRASLQNRQTRGALLPAVAKWYDLGKGPCIMATIDPRNQIKLSDEQCEQLAALSDETGKPWQELLSEFLVAYSVRVHTAQSAGDTDSFERELEKVAFHAPGLPCDFSRADIYIEHD